MHSTELLFQSNVHYFCKINKKCVCSFTYFICSYVADHLWTFINDERTCETELMIRLNPISADTNIQNIEQAQIFQHPSLSLPSNMLVAENNTNHCKFRLSYENVQKVMEEVYSNAMNIKSSCTRLILLSTLDSEFHQSNH